MEGCWAVILQDSRGIKKNPNFDPTKPDSWPNIPVTHDLNWAHFFSKRGEDVLKVWDKTGTLIEWEGAITINRAALAKQNYSLSYIPNEVPLDQWLSWFKQERKAEVSTRNSVLAEQDATKIN